MENYLWFICINGSVEGPLTFENLKKDLRINPDTMVWRKGFDKWRPARAVQELADLFKDDLQKNDDFEEEQRASSQISFMDHEIAMNIQKEPPLLKFWFLIFILSFIYIYFYLYYYYF